MAGKLRQTDFAFREIQMMKYQIIRMSLWVCVLVVSSGARAAESVKAPFKYVWAKAYHILPETHNNESGYFSLVDGLDGKMYIGTTKYHQNSYLVQFDPKTEKQKIVIDVHKLCGLTASGFAAQSKIHTRNFVGKSGKVYCGSMQGYRDGDDKSDYPGGYVMVYDPKTNQAENLGMPSRGKSVIDVAADEKRGLIYAVILKPDNFWMVYNTNQRSWRKLGPISLYYGQTLIDGQGRAYTITKDGFRLARYDPVSEKVTVRRIQIGQEMLRQHMPNWRLGPDGRTSYLMGQDETTLWSVDLFSEEEVVKATRVGKMLQGKNLRCVIGMDVAPDGRVYAVIRVDNETDFVGQTHSQSHFPGRGFLHHLTRYDPQTGKIEDLGVLAISNPDFLDLARTPHCHGYQKFPDGTLAPRDHHFALKINKDGEVYITTIYPFALLRIRGLGTISNDERK